MRRAGRICLSVVTVACSLSAAAAAQRTSGPGAALIVGQVVDASDGRPVSGAIVTITGPGAESQPRVLTRSDGRFVFGALRAGSYALTAVKSGFTPGAYGQQHPAGDPEPIRLTDGERVGNVTVRLWRTAAISGTVIDEAGERQIGLLVRAFRRSVVGGRRAFVQQASARTDDQGMFRLGGLVPGHYIVGTVPHYASVPATAGPPADAAVSGTDAPAFVAGEGAIRLPDGTPLAPQASGPPAIYPPAYHPFSPGPDAATVITVAPGEEYEQADLHVIPVAARSVSGRIFGPDGPIPRAALHLALNGAPPDTLEGGWLSATSDASGRFVFPAVPVGHYVLRMTQPQVHGTSANGIVTVDRDILWVDAPVSVGLEPIDNWLVEASRGLRVAGEVEYAGSAVRPAGVSTVQIALEPAGHASSAVTRPLPNGRFTSPGIRPGRYFVRVPNSPAGWMFAGATYQGRDVTDAPLEVSESVDGVIVRFTDRWSGVNGYAVNRAGRDAGAVVVLFPTDATLWESSGNNRRRLRSARTNRTGGFGLTAPPGDYFIASIDGSMAGDWDAVDALESLSRGATRITIREGEHHSIELRTVPAK